MSLRGNEKCSGEVQMKVSANSHERRTKISVDKKRNNEKNPEFPNFAALTKEEKSVFFEALSAARKNVEKTGVQARECFGTVHDEYLDYFAASSTTSFGTQGTYTVSGWPPDGTASDDALASEEAFASVRVPLPPETNFGLASAWEGALGEGRDQMLELYLKEKKSETERSKGHFDPTEETSSENWMVVNENFSFETEEENLDKSKGMPKFEALNVEEKQMFFKILKEARENVQERNPEMEILSFESILRRYEARNEAVIAFSQEGRTQKESKNLRVKLTLTSVDNQRLKAKAAKECFGVRVSCQTQPENLDQGTMEFYNDEPGFSDVKIGATRGRLEDDKVSRNSFIGNSEQESNQNRDAGNTNGLNEKGAKWEANKSTVSVAIEKKEKVTEKFENNLTSDKEEEIVESIMFSEAGEIEMKTLSDLDEKKMKAEEEKIQFGTSTILLPSEQENKIVSWEEGPKSEEGEEEDKNIACLFDADSILMAQKSGSPIADSNESTHSGCDETGMDSVTGLENMEGFHEENYVLETLAPRENDEVKTEREWKAVESRPMNEVASEMKGKQVVKSVLSENHRSFSDEVKHLYSVENTGTDREVPKVRSSLTCPNVYLKFKENLKQASAEKQDTPGRVARSLSHTSFNGRKGSKSANVDQPEPPSDEKKSFKDKTSSLMLVTPSVESVSTSDSDNETLLVPMFVRKKKLPTTKIRVLQDLLKDRAEFVEGSISEFKIVNVPHEEIRSSETPTARLHVEEEDEEDEDAREERGGKSKFFKALAKLCRCGKKEVTEEENILENLKGEAVAVDVSKAVKNPASVTQNESTMEVLKAAERKKIIQKYWKTS